MKYLLTSAGIKNPSIHEALVRLLGKPIEESTALAIPTAMYGHPMIRPDMTWNFISGQEPQCPMTELGWKSVGMLELTALPSIDRERWIPWVEEADVLLVGGGSALYLARWMRESGLADLLPSLSDSTWVGLSGGSMVMTPRLGEDFVAARPFVTGADHTLGLVDFSIFPHLEHPDMSGHGMEDAETWAAKLDIPAYAIDDETAIAVVDGKTEVISEGRWRFFDT